MLIRDGLAAFAEQNPQLQVVAQPLKGRHPVAVGKYRTKEHPKVWDLKNKSPEDILKCLQVMRDSNSRSPKKRLNKPVVSQQPSIQGPWHYGRTADATFVIKDV